MVSSVEAADDNAILAPGDMLGCYRIDSFLGRGGFGVTYLALDTSLELQVAIKEYMPAQIAERREDSSVRAISTADSATFSWGLSRFIKEAQTLAKFRHPSIVRVMSVFEDNGTAYMVMEYERGRELRQLLHEPQIRNEESLKRIVGPVIDGLSEVHRHGYIHRDIKPANILIRHDGTPVLLDFGSARLATGAQTQSLTALVSVGYAPLEQYNDNNDSQQGPWTDIYALGAVLYYAVSGIVPVDSTLRGSAVVNEQNDPLKPLETVAPEGFSIPFCRAIDWALSFRIKDRPQTLMEWRKRLLQTGFAPDDDTVLMPKIATQSLRNNPIYTDEITARNEVLPPPVGATGTSAGAHRPASNPPFTDQQSHPLHTLTEPLTDLSATDDDWQTTRERELRNRRLDADQSTHGAHHKPARSRLPLVALLFCAVVVIAAFGTMSQWLPGLQNQLSGEPAAVAQTVEASEQTSDVSAPADAQLSSTNNTTLATDAAAQPQADQAAERIAAEQRPGAAAEAQRQAEREAERIAAEQRQQAEAAAEAQRQAEREAERIAAEQRQQAEAAAEVQRQAEQEAERIAAEQRRQAEAAAEAQRQAEREAERIAAAQRQQAEAAAEAQRQAEQEAERIAAAQRQQLEAAVEAQRQAELEAERIAAEQRRQAEAAAEARRQAEREAENTARETSQLAAIDTTQGSQQQAQTRARAITDQDIGNVFRRFQLVKEAIENRDEAALAELTLPSERKMSYFNYLFRTFETIEVSLSGVRASPGDQTVRANLQIQRMRRSNGDVVFPPAEFKSIPVYSIRDDDWSRIHW